MDNSIVVIGKGGLFKQIEDIVDSINTYSISRKGKVKVRAILLGDEPISKNYLYLIGFASLNDPEQRERVYNTIKNEGMFATVIASTAVVSPKSIIADGAIVLHSAFVGPDANLDVNVLICTKAIVEHDSRIGQHTSILTGAIINGDCNIGCCCVIGSGAVILQGINICDDVIVGAGAVVTKDIIESGTYTGCPARKVK